MQSLSRSEPYSATRAAHTAPTRQYIYIYIYIYIYVCMHLYVATHHFTGPEKGSRKRGSNHEITLKSP